MSCQFFHRKVPSVPGDDQGSASDDGGRDDVTIIGIRQIDRRDMTLIIGDPRIR